MSLITPPDSPLKGGPRLMFRLELKQSQLETSPKRTVTLRPHPNTVSWRPPPPPTLLAEAIPRKQVQT